VVFLPCSIEFGIPQPELLDGLSMRMRNDLNCGPWDYEYNQQLDSESGWDFVKELLWNTAQPPL
jgi:hypothetical protein